VQAARHLPKLAAAAAIHNAIPAAQHSNDKQRQQQAACQQGNQNKHPGIPAGHVALCRLAAVALKPSAAMFNYTLAMQLRLHIHRCISPAQEQ
jgi:hypothetical protein